MSFSSRYRKRKAPEKFLNPVPFISTSNSSSNDEPLLLVNSGSPQTWVPPKEINMEAWKADHQSLDTTLVSMTPDQIALISRRKRFRKKVQNETVLPPKIELQNNKENLNVYKLTKPSQNDNIEVVEDDSFDELIGKWNIVLKKLNDFARYFKYFICNSVTVRKVSV